MTRDSQTVENVLIFILTVILIVGFAFGVAHENARVQYPGFEKGYVDPVSVELRNHRLPDSY